MARPCFKLEKVHPDPVAGVDEAGCAPLAGPVVAAAVVLDRERFPRGIDDSKVVPVKDREAICAKLYKVARLIASMRAQKMLRRSISSTLAMPTPTTATFISRAQITSRIVAGSALLSSIPRGNFVRSRITAAATTGPASGAHPASSTPASGSG